MIRNQKGFSLVEIMIVLVIIGTVLGLIAKSVFGNKERADDKQVKIMIQQIQSQLDMYQLDCKTYPSSSQGLSALVKEPSGDPTCESWGPSPYTDKVPRDPWGSEFEYQSDGIDYEIISYGKDKKPGGAKDYSSKKL